MRRTRSALALAAGIAALAAAPASAAPGWGAATEVPTSPFGGYPTVAHDADGTATAMWVQNSGEQVIKSAVKPDGGSWSAPATLTGAFAGSGRPSVAVAPDGSAVATWRDNGEIESATRGEDGRWSPVQTLSVAGELATGDPGLVVDAEGTATTAWSQGCAVLVSSRPARSDTWTNPRAVFEVPDGCGPSTADYGTIPRPVSLGVDRNGSVTVLWRTGTTTTSSIKSVKSAVRTGGARGTWSAPKLIATPAGRVASNQHEARVVVDVDGRAVATWPVFDSGAEAATRPAGTDAAWDAAVQPLPAPRLTVPALALDGHGRASVVWSTVEDGATPPSVKLATVTAEGSWSAAETVATLPTGEAAPYAPQLALDDDGGALVAWSRNATTGATVESARRPAGGAWSALATLAADAPKLTVVALAGDALGNTTAAWPVGPDAVDAGDTSALRAIATADYAVEPALELAWSGRADPTVNSLWSWVTYLYRSGQVELSDGASWPDPADRYSWQWAQSDAWRDVASGELVIEHQGTLRFSMPAHFIDIRLTNPTLRVSADGRRARLISDGLASGTMEEARAGRETLTPFTALHVLDVDLDAGGYRAGAAVGRRSWIAAPATMTSIAGETLHINYAGVPFGVLTFSAPATVPDRVPPPIDPPRPPFDPPADVPRPPVDPPRPPVDPPRTPVDPPRAAIRPARRVKVAATGTATVATVTCPRGGAACALRLPRSLTVRVGSRRHALRLLAPARVRAGARAQVRVRLSRASRAGLAGRTFRVAFRVRVTIAGSATSTLVRTRLTVPKARRAPRGGR